MELQNKQRFYKWFTNSLFSEEQRLTPLELGQIDNWRVELLSLVYRAPKNPKEQLFQDCARGIEDPKSTNEQIIVKLIYQALAMGGFITNEEIETSWSFLEINEFPFNDIDSLVWSPLKDFLRGIRGKMSIISYQQVIAHHDLIDSLLFEGNDPSPNESDHANEEYEVIAEEIALYSEDYARSDENGWFYNDDDE